MLFSMTAFFPLKTNIPLFYTSTGSSLTLSFGSLLITV